MDLLNIDDPTDIGDPLDGLPEGKFTMPFDSIECVVVMDDQTPGVAMSTPGT